MKIQSLNLEDLSPVWEGCLKAREQCYQIDNVTEESPRNYSNFS